MYPWSMDVTVVFLKKGITRELRKRNLLQKEIETRVFFDAVKLTHIQQC